MTTLLRWFQKHKIITIGLLLALFGATFLIRQRLKGGSRNTSIGVVRRGLVLESVYGIGTVTAVRSYQLKMGVVSTIRKIFVREGDTVKRGQRLADLEGTGNFSAPFDGTITFLPARDGETVFAQSVILNLVDLSDRYLLVSLEQRGAIRVKQGQKAKISFDNMRGNSYDGIVESLYSNDNSFLVRVGAQSLPPQILPGMTADVAIAVGEHAGALLVPAGALESGHVFVKRGFGRPTPIPVETGLADGAVVEITLGDLKEGEELFIEKRPGP